MKLPEFRYRGIMIVLALLAALLAWQRQGELMDAVHAVHRDVQRLLAAEAEPKQP